MHHNYYQSSAYEKKWHPLADAFYLSKYNNCKIIRYSSQSKVDIQFQKKDIDCTIIYNGRTVHISEKFRTKDYGDLLIELYSKYPHTSGWIKDSEADFLAYFAEENVYIIPIREIQIGWNKIDTDNKLKAEIESFHFDNLYKSSQKKLSFGDIQFSLIQAYNKLESADWHTISVAIRWDDLKKQGIDYKLFQTNSLLK